MSVGSVIDPRSRTLPVIYEATNADGTLKIGSIVRILPNHACATAAQHAEYHVLRRGRLDGRDLPAHRTQRPVSEIMEPAFQLVDAHEEIERVIPMLAEKSPAVLVQRSGELVGIITRADILNHMILHG